MIKFYVYSFMRKNKKPHKVLTLHKLLLKFQAKQQPLHNEYFIQLVKRGDFDRI